MTWLRGASKVKNSILAFGILLLLIVSLSFLYWTDVISNVKWLPILSGLLTGFIVSVFQVFLSVRELNKLDKYDAMGIVAILSTRDDPNYYRALIEHAEDEIKILGVTCKRFLDDFANCEANAPSKNKVLLKALDNGLRVKILIADHRFLIEEDKPKAAAAGKQLAQLAAKYQDQFQYVAYEHEPTHSIVVIDRQSIVGPSFPHVSSKFSPAIHLRHGSKFSGRYLEYFDKEWDKWTDGKKHLE